jgi:hypothetical protein
VDLKLRPFRAARDAISRRPRLKVRRGAAAVLACALGVALLSVGGSASALNTAKTGPKDNRGFPSYYMDESGRALQMCDDGTPFCQGVGAGDVTPPDGEAFFWLAVAHLKTNRGPLDVEMALEAAFAGQRPIVFNRLRIRGHLNQKGNYILKYPYGQVKFHAIGAAEQRNVDFTRDVPCSTTRGGRCAEKIHRWLKSTVKAKGYLGPTRRTTVTGGSKRNNLELLAKDNGRTIGTQNKFRIVGKRCGAGCRTRARN